MLKMVASAIAVALALHAVIYLVRRQRARSAEMQRLRNPDGGVVHGAEAIHLSGSGTHAVLLLHGFGDTPQTLRGLAHYLNTTDGWTVSAPLLPGHGRTLAALDHAGSAEWRALVRAEYAALCSAYPTVALVGLSVGGALATIQAATDPNLPALVLLAPYLTPPPRAERLAPLATVLHLLVPYMKGGDRVASIFDPSARERSLGYSMAPPHRVRDVVTVAHDARYAAADVRAPTLIIHSRTDYRIPLPQAQTHQALFTRALRCEQQWLDGCGHVITVDYCRELVWESTASWLREYAGAPRAAFQPLS
jgi:carboxylesterase